jgi:N-acyl-D-aspartate/D-glutamate deacylase
LLLGNAGSGKTGSPTMRHPRGYGSFAKVIRKFVNEDKLLTLEQAIHKMSGLPAETVGLDKTATPARESAKPGTPARGTLKPGNAADILIFDPAKVKDTATFEEPHQLAEGFDTVIVNGKVIRQNRQFNNERNGQVLKREE